jgi:hypothetical protein
VDSLEVMFGGSSGEEPEKSNHSISQ